MWTLREAQRLKQGGTWPQALGGPTSISGLQCWLDAADATTLFDATTGGSLVAADGGVARWEDKSGNGRHFSQSDSAKRPQRKTAQQNGLDSLLFDGSNDSLIGSNFSSGTGGLSILLVVKRNATGANHELINKGVDNGGWMVKFAAANTVEVSSYRDSTLNNNTIRATTSSVAATGYTVLSTVAGSGAFNTASVFRNGTSQAMSAATEAGTNGRTPSTGSDPVRIGVQVYAGVDYFTYNGNIAEIIIYDSALSDTDRGLVESYLMSKWGIS
jgi:hypothetical protein